MHLSEDEAAGKVMRNLSAIAAVEGASLSQPCGGLHTNLLHRLWHFYLRHTLQSIKCSL